jgi:hypothetical protein
VTNPTLGRLAFGLTYGRPEPAIEAVADTPSIKSATLIVTVDYEADAPLSCEQEPLWISIAAGRSLAGGPTVPAMDRCQAGGDQGV